MLMEQQEMQLRNAHGKVDRVMYQEDWVHREKAREMITQLATDDTLEMLEATGMKDKLLAQYTEARNIEKKINENRRKLAHRIDGAKQKLEAIQ